MFTKSSTVLAILTAVAVWASPTVADPGFGRNAPEGDTPTLDARFLAISGQVPEFAGLFLDEEGRLHVGLTDTNRMPDAIEAVRQVFGNALDSHTDPAPVETRYSFAELHDLYQDVVPLLTLPGVVFTDIDERENRIVVGVTGGDARSDIETKLARLRIPPETVRIETSEPIARSAGFRPMPGDFWSLRDHSRPAKGGMQIARPIGRWSEALCTLGFNAVRNAKTRFEQKGFVTNSHCTAVQGGVESTTFYQPSTFSAECPTGDCRLGVESIDPAYTTCGTRRCRHSDAAFISYDDDTEEWPGFIARPGLNTIDVFRTNQFNIVRTGWLPLGYKVTKVGRTTGRTEGVISRKCVDVNVAGTDLTLLCQDAYRAASNKGDSGSPVFLNLNEREATLLGIHWGHNSSESFYSPYQNIVRELGNLYVIPWEF